MSKPTKPEWRDAANGQFVHSSLGAMCVCGHTLGNHSSMTIEGKRPCYVNQVSDETCDCMRFRKTRKATATPTWESYTADQLGDLVRHGKSSSIKATALLHLVQRASLVDPLKRRQ